MLFRSQNDETIALATHTVSGVALVGEGREVTKVEVSTNGGSTWETAQLLNYFVPNAWKHWEFTWEVTQAGRNQIVARAEDDLGNLQSEDHILFGWSRSQLSVYVDVVCFADFNDNQRVGTDDVGILIEEWATTDCDPDNETKCCRADANENGRVGTGDVGIIIEEWATLDCPAITPPCTEF